MQVAAVVKAPALAQASRSGAEEGPSSGLPFSEVLAAQTASAAPAASQKAPAVVQKGPDGTVAKADEASCEEGDVDAVAEDDGGAEVASSVVATVVAAPVAMKSVETGVALVEGDSTGLNIAGTLAAQQEAAGAAVQVQTQQVQAQTAQVAQAQIQTQTDDAPAGEQVEVASFAALLAEADVAEGEVVKPAGEVTPGAAALAVEEGDVDTEAAAVEVDLDVDESGGDAPDLDKALLSYLEHESGGVGSELTPSPGSVELAEPDVASKGQTESRVVQTVVSSGGPPGGGEAVRVEEVVEVRPSPGHLKETVVKSVRLLVARGEQTLSVRLSPPSLGELHVEVAHGHDGIQVRLMSASGAVRDALEGQLPGLRDSLARSGLSGASVSVSLDAASAQGGGGHAQQDAREALGSRSGLAGLRVETTAAPPPSRVMMMAGSGTLNVLV